MRKRRLVIGFIEAFLFAALPLFLGAGTLKWMAGWLSVAVFMIASLLITLMLWRHDPALLEERMKGLYQPGQPLWDKVLLTGVVILWIAWLVLIGLDGERYHWSHVPFWLRIAGFLAVVASYAGMAVVMRANSFLAPVVRVQSERGHTVVSTGPYAVVCHPLYATVLLLFFGTPLMLNSWWGLLGAAALTAVLIVRTILEDQVLQKDLPGYADYAQRVKFRLVPLIW